MKKHVLMLSTAVLLASQAMAATEVADTDGNGTYSMEEMVVSYPDLTEEQFADMDADESGEIDDTEMVKAIENGIIGG